MERKKQILICDDNPDILELMGLILEKEFEVEVHGFKSSTDLMLYLHRAENLPELIILDLMLPDIEGDDLVKALRLSPKFSSIPIILMSGIIVNVNQRAQGVGADEFLLKPFSSQDINKKVAPWIRA